MSNNSGEKIQKLSVIVPKNPFSPQELSEKGHCLCALDVEKLIEWWPGKPHAPNRDPLKVKTIQRSLDWKRVALIASYLLQEEIYDTGVRIDKYFKEIYEPLENEPGRDWPPRVSKTTGFETSEFPIFSNVLIHVNGARIEKINSNGTDCNQSAHLVFDENDKNLNFFVIDGQHRINGAYLALCIKKEKAKNEHLKWEIPSQIFLDLDAKEEPPRIQSQIFIDVNFYQKKVDRSLVADLFPTARGKRTTLNNKERAQDIGRKLMLETGPLVGMIQIPGIKYGVKDVVTLSTLNLAIENVIQFLDDYNITSLELQTELLSHVLSCWFEATGRFEKTNNKIDNKNVVYQGRVLVSIIDLLPAILLEMHEDQNKYLSTEAKSNLINWFEKVLNKANLIKDGKFIDKNQFKELKYLGAGGIKRFKDTLWASINDNEYYEEEQSDISVKAEINRGKTYKDLANIVRKSTI